MPHPLSEYLELICLSALFNEISYASHAYKPIAHLIAQYEAHTIIEKTTRKLL